MIRGLKDKGRVLLNSAVQKDRHIEDMTFVAIGRKYGFSSERVRQIVTRSEVADLSSYFNCGGYMRVLERVTHVLERARIDGGWLDEEVAHAVLRELGLDDDGKPEVADTSDTSSNLEHG